MYVTLHSAIDEGLMNSDGFREFPVSSYLGQCNTLNIFLECGCRGSLMASFQVDIIQDTEVRGLVLFTLSSKNCNFLIVHCSLQTNYRKHISYPSHIFFPGTTLAPIFLETLGMEEEVLNGWIINFLLVPEVGRVSSDFALSRRLEIGVPYPPAALISHCGKARPALNSTL